MTVVTTGAKVLRTMMTLRPLVKVARRTSGPVALCPRAAQRPSTASMGVSHEQGLICDFKLSTLNSSLRLLRSFRSDEVFNDEWRIQTASELHSRTTVMQLQHV